MLPCREHVELLLLPTELLAQRVVDLKLALPRANVAKLLQTGPWLLLLEVSSFKLNCQYDVQPKIADLFDLSEQSSGRIDVAFSSTLYLRRKEQRNMHRSQGQTAFFHCIP